MCRSKRKLCSRTKKLESPSQQEIIEKTEEDIFSKYNNSYYEYFCNYLFPQALEYGMSAEEFWRDDPQLFVSYRISFINKKKREMEEVDYKNWLLGLYIHDGNGKLMSSLKQMIGNIIAGISKGKKDNTKIDTYPKKPYFEMEKELKLKENENNKKKKYEAFEESIRYYGTMKQRYLKELEKKQKKGE